MKHLLTLLLLSISIGSYSQQNQPAKEFTLTEMNQKEIIDSLAKELEEFYIRPKAIGDITKKLNENYKKGSYKNISKPNEFASKLSSDLIDVSKDLHFSVMYNP